MYTDEQKRLEQDLQSLVISFDTLYAECLIGVSASSVYLTNEAFFSLAIPDSIQGIEGDGHKKAVTNNGLRITTIIYEEK